MITNEVLNDGDMLAAQYETYVKRCVRANMIPMNPDEWQAANKPVDAVPALQPKAEPLDKAPARVLPDFTYGTKARTFRRLLVAADAADKDSIIAEHMACITERAKGARHLCPCGSCRE